MQYFCRIMAELLIKLTKQREERQRERAGKEREKASKHVSALFHSMQEI